MATGGIDKKKVLNDDVKKAFEDLNVAIKTTHELIVSLTDQANQMSIALKNSNIKELTEVQKNYNITQNASIQSQKQAIELETKRQQLEAATERTIQAKTKTEIQATKESERQAKIAERNEKITARLTSAYAQESARLTQLRNSTKDLAVEIQRLELAEGKGSVKVQELTAQFTKQASQVLKLDANLKKIDASMGQHQRFVGQYEKGYYGLNTSINQLTRELPALGMNLNTFFLAISNNIPMLADEIQKIRTANALAAKEGKAAVPLWKQLTKAIFSWQTAMSVGVALLTIYGKDIVEWIGKLLKAKDALNATAQAQEKLNAAKKEAVNVYVAEQEKLRLMYQASTDMTLSENERIENAQRLKKEFGDTFKNLTAEEIALGKGAKAYNELNASIAKAAESKELFKTITENETKIRELETKRKAEQAKIDKNDAENKIGYDKRIAIQSNKTAQANIDKYDKEIKSLREVNSILETSIDVRALSSSANDKAIKGINEEKENVDKLIAEQEKLLEAERNKITVGEEDLAQKNANIAAIEREIARLKALGTGYDELAAAMYKASTETSKLISDAIKDNNKELLDAEKEMDAEWLKELKESVEIQKKLDDELADYKKQNAEATYDLVSELSNALYETQINNLQDESDAIETEYAKRLDNEELTEEQRSAIEAERDRKLEENAQKQADLETKQFLLQQAFEVGEVIIDTFKKSAAATAQGNLLASNPVTAALAPNAYAQAAAIKLNGALTTASILAQTIPALDKGSDNTPSTFIMSEKNPELFTDRFGNTSLFTEPTLMMGDKFKGGKVTSSLETAKMLDNARNNYLANSTSNKKDMDSIQMLMALNEINKSVNKQRLSLKIINEKDYKSTAIYKKLKHG